MFCFFVVTAVCSPKTSRRYETNDAHRLVVFIFTFVPMIGFEEKVKRCQQDQEQLSQNVASAADKVLCVQEALANTVSKTHLDEALGMLRKRPSRRYR